MMRRACVLGVGMMAAILFTVQPAAAQVNFGIRGGLSGGPDQVFVGGHVESPDLGHRTTLRPNVEAGFGDDVTPMTLNLELVYWMPLKGSAWQVYAGGGVGTNFWITDESKFMYGTLNVVFGVQHTKGLFTEMKVGIEPSVKLTSATCC